MYPASLGAGITDSIFIIVAGYFSILELIFTFHFLEDFSVLLQGCFVHNY
jgi:hypothetical protein